MYSGRFTTGSSAVRKTRVDGKPSLLPQPRRPGSTDRASTDARRPSAGPRRSSSAEPARATLAASRPSKEASASKIPMNRRSRSQQAESRYGQMSMTPLHGSHYSRATATPVRTPSEDRQSRSWQGCVERALAFVTVKDQRPLSNLAWQRGELARVQEALAARGPALALFRPLTIARFVDIVSALLGEAVCDTKLSNDNYVAKLPHIAKRFLYPGVVAKSWLKTVNTLHAFPHALAFISYLLDLVSHIKMPVSDEWLYLEKDELACLRRDYLVKCWFRFQEPEHQFDDLNQEYLAGLRALLGDNEPKIAQLKEVIGKCEAELEDESELAERAMEERLRARRDALAASLRRVRAERRDVRAAADALQTRRQERAAAARALDANIAAATADIQQLKKELEEQSMSREERARLLDQVDYATRVADSKRTLAAQLSKMLAAKETELGSWQKRTLDSCVEYKQRLIQVAARHPGLAALAVDEKELMEPECAAAVSRAVDTLRAHAHALADQRSQHARQRSALSRRRATQLEEARANVSELKAHIAREQQALEAELAADAADGAASEARRATLAERARALAERAERHARTQAELQFWQQQEETWGTKLSELHEYIEQFEAETARSLHAEKRAIADAVKASARAWHAQLDALEAQERAAEGRAAAADSSTKKITK